MEIISINISELKPHPNNEAIYGKEDISELKEKIRKSGLVTTLTITKKNVILSGNRRWKACSQLVQDGDERFKTVDCEIRNFENEEDELEYLVICNDTRDKTMEQKAREAQALIEIEKKRAEKRRLATQNNNTAEKVKKEIADVAELPPQLNSGKTRDIVAKKLKMKSGREVERAVKSVETIDKLTETGRKDDADLIRDTLNNKSASTAADLSSHIDELTEEEKQAIRDKKMSAYKAISKYATKRVPKIKEDMSTETKEELALQQTCKEVVEEYIAQSMGLIEPSDIPVDDNTDDLIAFFDSSVSTLTAAISNLSKDKNKYSIEQITRIMSIVNDARNKLNELDLLTITQIPDDNNNDDKLIFDEQESFSLEECAKRLKNDSEEPLTLSMITGLFKVQTESYIESIVDYIHMVDSVTDKRYTRDEAITGITLTFDKVVQAVTSLKGAIIDKSQRLSM